VAIHLLVKTSSTLATRFMARKTTNTRTSQKGLSPLQQTSIFLIISFILSVIVMYIYATTPMKTRIVPCYDGEKNKILGVACVENYQFDEFIAITLMAATTLFIMVFMFSIGIFLFLLVLKCIKI
jgi:hypothetical protein